MNPCSSPLPTDTLAPLTSSPLPRWKRILDITCSLLALPLLAPVAMLIYIITKTSARGPILFKQARVGHAGKPFLCFKFRTMQVGADTKGHQAHLTALMGTNAPMVKMDARGDSRLIPGGWILRATGIDELPQIINVLRGEMSLVGPRPCIPYEYENYLPEQKQRFASTPGLTGLWQVSGKNNTTFDEMIRLDIEYGQKKSLLLDTKIILFTVPALIIQVFETRSRRLAAARVNPAPVSTMNSPVPREYAGQTVQAN